MTPDLPNPLNVLALTRGIDDVEARIEAVAPGRVKATYAFPDFIPEMTRDWDEGMMIRYRSQDKPARDAQECEALVRDAHIMLLAVPYPKTLPGRAENLRWAHFTFAGVSNLRDSDWWGWTGSPITSSRGWTNAIPIAETVMGAAFMFAKRLDWAVERSLQDAAHDVHGFPGMKLISGRTLAVIGLGGIGSNVARLAKACGMRVIATRRSAVQRATDVDGIDEIFPPSQLPDLMALADFIAVCAMWTPETEGMLGPEALAAVKPGAYLINVARGEIIDETALVAALSDGRLAGAYLDVWRNDFAHPPADALLNAPNVIFTPHVSGRVDRSHAFAFDLFCRNLDRFLNGHPLENIIDWSRGY